LRRAVAATFRAAVNVLGGIVGTAVAVFALTLAVGPWLVVGGLIPAPQGQLRDLKLADDATLSVAGATLLLALFTAVLALYTRASVVEGRKEGLVAERALEASWRPILVDVPAGLFTTAGGFGLWDMGRVRIQEMGVPLERLRVVLPLRNVGTGPAIITSGSLSIRDHKSLAVAEISAPIVPPGANELTKIEFDISVARKDLGTLVEDLQKPGDDRPPWLVVVGYTDQAGSNLWRTEVHIYPSDGSSWFVRQVALVDGKTGRPVVMSGPKSR
jgi:hypothetical protein